MQFILTAFVIYFLVLVFLYFYQRNLLYNPSENNYLNDKINFKYQEIFIDTDEDIKIKSWFIKKDLKKMRYDEIIEDHLYRTLKGQEVWLKLGFPYVIDKNIKS